MSSEGKRIQININTGESKYIGIDNAGFRSKRFVVYHNDNKVISYDTITSKKVELDNFNPKDLNSHDWAVTGNLKLYEDKYLTVLDNKLDNNVMFRIWSLITGKEIDSTILPSGFNPDNIDIPNASDAEKFKFKIKAMDLSNDGSSIALCVKVSKWRYCESDSDTSDTLDSSSDESVGGYYQYLRTDIFIISNGRFTKLFEFKKEEYSRDKILFSKDGNNILIDDIILSLPQK